MPGSLDTRTHWTRVVLGEGRPAVHGAGSAGLGGVPLSPAGERDGGVFLHGGRQESVGVGASHAGTEHRARFANPHDLRRGIIVRYRAA